MNKFLIYIPARKGSKRLPDKNFKPFYKNFSITEIAIQQAFQLNLDGRVLLDTDNLIFAKEMSNKYPNLHIHNRSSNFSGDEISIQNTIKALYEESKNITEDFRYTILLQPTSPVRYIDEIDQAIEHFKKKNLMMLASVSKAMYEPADLFELKNGKINKILKKKRSNIFFETGQFYIVNNNYLFQNDNPFSIISPDHIFETSPETSIDIDNEFQFQIAKIIYNKFC